MDDFKVKSGSLHKLIALSRRAMQRAGSDPTTSTRKPKGPVRPRAADVPIPVLPKDRYEPLPVVELPRSGPQILQLPNGRAVSFGSPLPGGKGSSKTAHAAFLNGSQDSTHVDVRSSQGDAAGEVSATEMAREADLTRRYADSSAVAVVTHEPDGTAVNHLIVKCMPHNSLEAVNGLEPKHKAIKTTKIIKDTARVLSKMHADGRVHGDIKPDNIRLTRDGVATPIDFGSAGRLDEPAAWGDGGNRTYRAPAFTQEDVPRNAGIDAHSLGVTTLVLLAGAGAKANPFHEFGAIGLSERLQPHLDALQNNAKPFNRETLKEMVGDDARALAFFEKAYATAPKLVEVVFRHMLGKDPATMEFIADRVDALIPKLQPGCVSFLTRSASSS